MEDYIENTYEKPLHLPGIFVSAIFLLILAIFEIILAKTQFLPDKYMFLLTGILLCLVVIVLLLVWNFHNHIRFIIGTSLAIVITAVFAIGGSYLQKTTETLGTITAVKTEISQVAVFVHADDPAESIENIGDYTFGFLEILDRENTDKTILEINEELGKEISTKSYIGLGELVDGILNQEVGAIILNQAYLDIVDEMEGYEGCSEKLRVLDVKHVETVIEEKVTDNKMDSISVSGNETDEIFEDIEENSDAVKESLETDDELIEDADTNITNADNTIDVSEVSDVTEDQSNVNEESSSKAKGEVLSIYISGIDTYGNVSAKSRSDVNIIATVNTGTKQVLLVSTPRDYYVPLSISNGIPDKLTHAGIYGIDVSKDTLGMLYGIDIPYYFRVNFSGFSGIIDALGGVTVHSDYDFNAGGYSYHVGENYLNGAQALAFARERYSFSSGDRQRGKNQMAVIQAVIQKAISPDLLKNFTSILEAVEGTFETSIPLTKVALLIRAQLDEGGDWNIVTYSVDGTGATKKPYSMSQNAYVMIPDQATVDKAKELMRQVRDGEVITLE